MAAPPPPKRLKTKISKEKPIYIDRNGNLKLLVGSGMVPMQVDANALRRASKVFNSMLFGPFSESNQTENWTVKLPEDDPEALRVIFHAVHGNFRHVPEDLTTSKLYNITVMADKYAMFDALKPWARLWTLVKDSDPWQPKDKEETSSEDVRSLLVLYRLGTCHQFSTTLSSLALRSKTDKNGQLLFKTTAEVDEEGCGSQSGEWVSIGLLPWRVIEFARNERRESILDLLSGLDTLFASCTSESDNLNNECCCRSTALGLMIRHLVQETLWPIPDTDDVRLSVAELSSIVGKIRKGIASQAFKICGTRTMRTKSCDFKLPPGCGAVKGLDLRDRAAVDFSQHFSTREARASED